MGGLKITNKNIVFPISGSEANTNDTEKPEPSTEEKPSSTSEKTEAMDEDAEEDSKDGDGEVSNMELSWEMFELTCVICTR